MSDQVEASRDSARTVVAREATSASVKQAILDVERRQLDVAKTTFKVFATHVASSSISNIAGTIAGHPLDTIRVRMQLTAGNPSMFQIVSETYRGEGLRGFFKGMVSPLIGVTPYNVMVFTSTETLKKQMQSWEMTDSSKSFIAGSFSGALGLIIYNPVELLKCRAQVNRQEFVRYRVAIPSLIANEGFMGLYKGFVPMLLRDVPGWGVYFFTYEYLKALMRHDSSEQKSIQKMNNLELLTLMWAGGVAGQMSWIVSYPWDVIKTTMQCTETQRLSMRQVIREAYAREGLHFFFKGLSPTLLRTFIVNAITLPTFDGLNQHFIPDTQAKKAKRLD